MYELSIQLLDSLNHLYTYLSDAISYILFCLNLRFTSFFLLLLFAVKFLPHSFVNELLADNSKLSMTPLYMGI